MRVLITGASGLFGSKLDQIIPKNYQVYSAYSKNQPIHRNPIKFDISNKNQVEHAFKKANPAVVVHAAALTDVDKCEMNKDLALKINVEGTKNIVEAVKTTNSFLIYISTDYVFNGERGRYKETDKPDPINYYGLTKLKAEELVKDSIDEHCIARASVIYGSTPAAGKINFALWLINKLKRKEQVKIIIDQWNSPTLNTNLADMTLEIIERKLTGTFHISGATRLSRYDFALQIAKTFNLNSNLISPITSATFSWSAKRPKDSSLDTAKAQQILQTCPLEITQALKRMKQEMEHFS
jgi:dTDP-4-dehydrorhamnose reductase